MTNEEKQLLLKDLSARLSYGVMLNLGAVRGTLRDIQVIHKYNNTDSVQEIDAYIQFFGDEYIDIIHFKPYLRTLSSMTDEELKEFYIIEDLGKHPVVWNKPQYNWHFTVNGIDWLNAHHFDYRGLIEKGLALEAPKDMYK